MSDTPDTFEARLVGYSKQSRADGDWVEVKFHIHPDDLTHSLATAPLKTVFMVAAVPVEKTASASPEAAVAQETTEPEKPKGGRLSQQAAMACNDPRFRSFLMDRKGRPANDCEDAALTVKAICGVSSRAQLDHDEIAAARWNALHAEFLADGGLGQ